ncbi:GDYXXLXY domain-containing protein [Aestuariicella hydrocarbonica]|uniref:GDYXXLXY domain-containing protein n=1 Tax=Pseudomaricurvus hydrocarbonicus TaxID=1470433 RepID=A0A9E5MMY4_9GAMM|nr:GDYXXLXY domain-containing protein [Aestuariicella hydrocarbonica]NHO67193.1 GDYXXLXY domain-containing protein [Aestuariicella hydrocarbonica]
MKRSTVAAGLGLAVIVQVCVLVGMVVKAAMPLWVGDEIRVQTVPVDPRSLFRGNYARLNYEIGRLPESALTDYPRLRKGEVVYISLRQGDDGLFHYADASLNTPAAGVFLRGRITDSSPVYRVKYGIEAYFAPKKKALKLEHDLRDGGVAVLMVSDNGQVALHNVLPGPDE